jgi:RNA polymerase sigma-70 factor (ECF subfamily)
MRTISLFSPGGAQLVRDPKAFAELYRQHAQDVLVFFVRRTFEPEVAGDLMAETFAVAFEHRGSFRGTTAEESSAWIFGIARHQLSRYLRRGDAERRAVGRLGIDVPSLTRDDLSRLHELAGLAEVREHLTAALAGIGGDQQQAVWLRVVEECSYAEIGSRLGVSEQTARARVSRGLRALAAATDRNMIEGATA